MQDSAGEDALPDDTPRLFETTEPPPPRERDESEPAPLMAAMLELGRELWTLTERVRTIEAVAARNGYVTLDELRNYAPDLEEAAERDEARNEFFRRLLGPLREVRSR